MNKYDIQYNIKAEKNNRNITFKVATVREDGAPVIIYKNRVFRLDWVDIIELADRQGFFEEGEPYGLQRVK